MKTPVEKLIAESPRGKIVARQHGRRTRLHYIVGERSELLAQSVAARYRDQVDDGPFLSIEAASEHFGYHLRDCSVLMCRATDDWFAHPDTNLSAIVDETARQAFRKRLWDDAESANELSDYWRTKTGICATTEDEKIVVTRDEHGRESLVKIREREPRFFGASVGYKEKIDWNTVPQTTVKAWLPSTEPDCMIEVNGEWRPLETLKAIREASRSLNFASAEAD